MNHRILQIIAVLLLPLLPTPIFAADRHKPKATPTPQEFGNGPANAVLSIDQFSITVSTSQGSQSYNINPATSITVNGKNATVNQIQVNMIATITPSADCLTAVAIAATSPPTKGRH